MKNTLKWSVAANRVIQALSQMPLPPLVRFFFSYIFFPHLFKQLYHLRRCSHPNTLDLFCKITAQTRSRSTSLRKKRLLKPWDVLSPHPWSGGVWTTSLSNVCVWCLLCIWRLLETHLLLATPVLSAASESQRFTPLFILNTHTSAEWAAGVWECRSARS